MKLLANANQIRRADQIQISEYDFPGVILMENAGALTAARILEIFVAKSDFLVLAGPGNNGGDGLVIARHLHLAGKNVKLLLSHEAGRYQGDALINWEILRHLPVEVRQWNEKTGPEMLKSFPHPPLLIDALLGTGIESQLRAPISAMIEFFRDQALETVAIDIPSGLNASSGELINEVIPATHTFTFALAKICHYLHPASEFCGMVEVVDIGIWPNVIDTLDIKRRLVDHDWARTYLRQRPLHGHKGTFGHVLLVGGSRDMAGAMSLSALAALRGGAGLVTVFGPESVRLPLLSNVPEAMCLAMPDQPHGGLGEADAEAFTEALKGKDAVVIGPGLGANTETLNFLKKILPQIHLPTVIDADGLNLLALDPSLWESLPETCILTPHPGEIRRLLTSPNAITHRLEAAEKLARDKERIVILKGRHSLSCLPDGSTFVNLSGNPGMATAGSGDVLAGLLGALLAQQYPASIAAPLGVWLHGYAGDQAVKHWGQAGLSASEIANAIRFE